MFHRPSREGSDLTILSIRKPVNAEQRIYPFSYQLKRAVDFVLKRVPGSSLRAQSLIER